jgi:ubiquitin carboxyl-terminal hydrolase 34
MDGNEERMDVNPVCHIYKAGHLCKVVTQDSSDEDSLSAGDSVKSEDQENLQVSSSGYVETHSDSDADGERSGNEETPKKGKRKVLRRKKGQSKSQEGSSLEHEGPDHSPSVTIESGDIPEVSGPDEETESSRELRKANGIKIKTNDKTSKMDVSSGSGSAPELLEPNAVMTELSNLVQMTDNSAAIQEFVSPPNLLEGSDGGSYSSRMSTKSEKNMADFDGEESICEEELMQSLSQNQLVELAVRNPVSEA